MIFSLQFNSNYDKLKSRNTSKCFLFEKKEVFKVAKKTKKQKKEKKIGYFKQVKQEMKNVVFPKKKEIAKYTFATIFIVALLIGFFTIINLGLSVVKGMF